MEGNRSLVRTQVDVVHAVPPGLTFSTVSLSPISTDRDVRTDALTLDALPSPPYVTGTTPKNQSLLFFSGPTWGGVRLPLTFLNLVINADPA